MAREQIACRVLKASHRKLQPGQQFAIHLEVGEIKDVGLKLGKGGIEDWELWLEPVNPEDRPGGAPKRRRAQPVPGSQADDGDDEGEHEASLSLDEVRANLICTATGELDDEGDAGCWTAAGYATVKYVREWVIANTGERDPNWVTAAFIQELSDMDEEEVEE